MKRTLSLQDWLMLAILIVVVNVGIRLLDKPITADAQAGGPDVAVAMSADGRKAIIVRPGHYSVFDTVANKFRNGNW